MTRDDLIAVLPCYVCGDLPPELMAKIGAMIEADPEVRALVDELALSRGCCEEALRRAAPAILRLTPERPAPRPRAARWPLLLAVAALLSLGGILYGLRAPPTMSQAVAEDLARWSELDPRARPGWISGSDPAALSAALTAAGVAPPFNVIRGVEGDGSALLGVAPLEEGGLVVLMVDAQGREFSCVVLTARALPVARAELLPPPEPGLVELRSFPWGRKHGVTWTHDGKTCVLLGAHPRGVVEAFAKRRVWGG